MVQREQLAEELNNVKSRYDAHVLQTQTRLSEEREAARRESKVLVQELNTKVR